MKWSLDTHKFMSEITRKALQILTDYHITSSSSELEIERAEQAMATAGVYSDEKAASGRIRRALFTYFKCYGCIDKNENLTEICRLFAENKLTLREFCFQFIVNYKLHSELGTYHPLRLLLLFLQKLSNQSKQQAFITSYDFSRLVEFNSYEELTDSFITEQIQNHMNNDHEVNERSIGFDVWSNILISSGLFEKNYNKALILSNLELGKWLLEAYGLTQNYYSHDINNGVFANLPQMPKLKVNVSNHNVYLSESKALQAYLFSKNIKNDEIESYIYNGSGKSFDDFLKTFDLVNKKGFYSDFAGLERLVGHCLTKINDINLQIIGNMLINLPISERQLQQLEAKIYAQNNQNKESLTHINVIYYGVPGAGKSHTIEKDYNINDGNSIVERVVFHPDYTYSDFVGQLLPTTEQDKVKYSFQPGPFTTILLSAIKNPNVQHILIIEEINRGNAPAIFGDLFQLLDREENGESKYKITNKEIANIAYETITDKNDAKISIPSNLTIVATMNTSDQNVFTLDTAFQRRWEMRLIENKFTEQHEFANKPILDTTVTWKTFCETMNSIIVGNGARTTSTEDKRLGIYFVKAKDIELGDGSKNQLRKFPEKVIKYLWDDAFKFNREDLFNASYNSLEDVIEAFMGNNGPERFNIFKADVINLLKPTVEHKEETTEPDNDVAQQ